MTQQHPSGPAPLRLKRHEDRRIRAGHLWVYSNEVDTRATPLGAFEPGAEAILYDSGGRALGTAYVNPHSLICARLLSRNPAVRFDRELIETRITAALALRARLYPEPYYRLIYGEGDGLPGLIVDRYGDVLVVQCTTAGMQRREALVLEVLQAQLRPSGILLRNDSPVRALEGLEPEVRVAAGRIDPTVVVREDGLAFEAPLEGGQKTGWYYDQRDNRARLARYVRGARVLDGFSYVGGWGVRAAHAGARAVVCVDSSQQALEYVRANAARNGCAHAVQTRAGEALEVLRALRAEGARFDVVIVDPPAFVKRKKDLDAGLKAYLRLNRLALAVLDDDGILVSSSCSFHVGAAQLLRVLLQAGVGAGRWLQVLEHGRQGPDHPVHPAIPETEYLKTFWLRARRESRARSSAGRPEA